MPPSVRRLQRNIARAGGYQKRTAAIKTVPLRIFARCPSAVQSPGMTSTARFVAGAAALGLLLRLGFGLWYWVDKPLMKDEREYLLLATRVATGHGFTYPASATSDGFFERPPGFAVLLATTLVATRDPLVTTAVPDNLAALPATSTDIPAAITVVQCLVGTVVIVLVAALAGRAGGPVAAKLGALAAAVYPPIAWVSGYVLSEPMYSALALGATWLLLKAGDAAGAHRIRLGVMAGLMAGAALLTKEAMIFFLPLAALWLIWHQQRPLLIAFAAGAALIVLPWIVRNFVVHDQFILTAAHGGVTLWTGNNPLARGEGDLAANPDMGRARRALEAQHPGLSNQAMDDVYYAEVRNFVVQHPGQWLVLEARKLFYTFVPIGPSYTLHSNRYFLASLVSYGLLAPFALAGLWQLWRRPGPSPLWALGLLALSSVVVCLVFFPQERFRIPVLDPAAIVAAAVAVSSRRT
jgi:4-amino-4-deoxy-L-arabinose transferase-like glycosyltransferase